MMRLKYLATIALITALGVTFFYAFKPPNLGGGLFPWDKADHYVAFGVLTVLSLVVFPKRSLWAIGIAMALVGGAIELIQGLPWVHRDCDFWDWVAELCAIGTVYGCVIAARIRRGDVSDRG